jgi:hypothetical protein
VLAIRRGPAGWRCALSRRVWIALPSSEQTDYAWLLGRRVRLRVEPGRPLRAVALDLVPWPTERELRRRYGRTPSVWGSSEAWLWRVWLPVWQVWASARAGHLIAACRRRAASDLLKLIANPYAWASEARLPAVERAPFGLWEAVARRLRAERRWPPAWRLARLRLAWRIALRCTIARTGLRPVDLTVLRRPVARLLGLSSEGQVAEPTADEWAAFEARLDERGLVWPVALDRRRASVLSRLAANQRGWSFGGPASSGDTVARLAWSWTYSAVVGGAGTGKTTAIRRLADSVRRSGGRVALAALTGRAAAVLGADAKTLHRLLGYGPWGWGVRRVEADLVMVDEASMLTWDAAAALFEAATGRVVFVGDPGQLPPVSGERVFAELVARLPVVRLDRNRRAPSGRRLQTIVCDESDALVRAAVATVRDWARGAGGDEAWQVVSPYRHGPFGCIRFNILLQEILNPHGNPVPGTGLRIGDRVALTRPEPNCGAPNGLVGTLVRHEAHGAWLMVRGVTIGPLSVETLELAYALTIHRAQGSEWDRVLLLCPLTEDRRGFIDGAMRYVGLTRSRRETICLLS